jgi:mannose-1-phosphate guanylyltransferase
MKPRIHVVILGGGNGTRFWPVSRADSPKQFLALGGSDTSLIRQTALRSSPFHEWDRLWVVTTKEQSPALSHHLPEARVIVEPFACDTAASVGLATVHVAHADPDAVLIILPADHIVQNNKAFLDSLNMAVNLAITHPLLVTVGIEPTFPHTGFGYIKRGEQLGPLAFEVSRFFEKPSRERAEQYLESGDCYWNSGMFAWRPAALFGEMQSYLPVLATGLETIRASIGTPDEEVATSQVFRHLDPISIDFGVLEHSRRCGVVEAIPFGWNDVGSWDAWAELYQADEDNNVAVGDALLVDSRGCIVHSGRFTAVLGGDDLVVIDSPDALLVCPRNRVQDIKKIVKELRARGRTDLV